MGKRTLINLIFFAGVFVVLCVWAVNNVVVIDRLEDPYTITGDFEIAAGIMPNAEVAYLGVHYGRVSSVKRDPGHVHVTMKIDKGKHIPEGSTAQIGRKSAIGEPYINFTPPADYKGDDGPFIAPDKNVPVERTRTGLEISELLRSAATLVGSIDPDKASTLLEELANALNGRSDSLRTLTTSLDQLAATFAAKTDVLDRLAVNNTKIIKVVADHATDVGSSITNLSLLADSLEAANERGDVSVLLNQGTELMGRLGDVVADSKDNIDCILDDLSAVMDLTSQPDQIAGLKEVLDEGEYAFSITEKTLDHEADGVWVRTNLLLDEFQPPVPVYEPHIRPAPEKPIPPCDSTLSSVQHGPDFNPNRVLAQSTTVAGRSLPATGGAALAGVAAILLVAAAAARWVSRVAND